MSSRYINIKVNILDGQKDKIKQALKEESGVSIRLSCEDLEGDDILAFTKRQVERMAEACRQGKGLVIKMSKTQVQHNMKIEGGFLPLLAGLASSILPALTGTVVPALATGALSSVASNLVGKLFNIGQPAAQQSGSGLYIKKGGKCVKARLVGKGLYLRPYKGEKLNTLGDGLFLKTGNGFIDGKGLILGDSSPFKNIPILGWIL